MSDENLNYIIISDKVFTGSSVLSAALVKVSQGVIQELTPLETLSDLLLSNLKSQYHPTQIYYQPNTYLLPGLTDLNIRGSNEAELILSKAAFSGGITHAFIESTYPVKFESVNLAPVQVVSHREELLSSSKLIKIYLSQPDFYTPSTEDFSEIITEANELGKTVIVDCSVNDPRLLAMASPFRTEPQTNRLQGKVASHQVYASAIEAKVIESDEEEEVTDQQDSNPLVEAELRTYKFSGKTVFTEKPTSKFRPKALVIPILKAETSYDSYLHNIPRSWEIRGIKAVIENAHEGSLIHFSNISCVDSIAYLRENLTRFPGVSWETSPNYLIFNEQVMMKNDTLLKTYPPIRDKRNQESLLKHFRDGGIHCVASHHVYVKPEFKIKEFVRAVPGINSLGYGLSAIWTVSDKSDKDVEVIVQTMCVNPAKVAGIEAGIKVGLPADLICWDPWCKKKSFVYEESPYTRLDLLGEVKTVFLGKDVVYRFEDFR